MKTAQKIVMKDEDRVVDVYSEELVIEVKGSGSLVLKGQTPKSLSIYSPKTLSQNVTYDFKDLDLSKSEIRLFGKFVRLKILISSFKYRLFIRPFCEGRFLDIFEVDYNKVGDIYFGAFIVAVNMVDNISNIEKFDYKNIDAFLALVKIFGMQDVVDELLYSNEAVDTILQMVEEDSKEVPLEILLLFLEDMKIQSLLEISYWSLAHRSFQESLSIFEEFTYQVEQRAIFALLAPAIFSHLSRTIHTDSFEDYLKKRYGFYGGIEPFWSEWSVKKLLELWEEGSFLPNFLKENQRMWQHYIKSKYG